MIERRKFAELAGADHGWLKAKSTLPMRCISTCGTTILTPYEVIDALPGVPRESSWPVFAEPWQAQVFALTADTLDILLREAVALDPRDDGSRYYEHWLIALERLCLAKGLTDSEALDMRTAAWVDDYRRAPDGRPVELAGGLGSLLNHSRYLPLKNQVRCTPERGSGRKLEAEAGKPPA